MSESAAFDGIDLTDRVVLFELAAFERRGEAPVAELDLLRETRADAERLEDVLSGKLSEADLFRSCRSLAAEGLVREVPADETSPVGKGRPHFELAVDPDDVRERLREDDRLAGLVGSER